MTAAVPVPVTARSALGSRAQLRSAIGRAGRPDPLLVALRGYRPASRLDDVDPKSQRDRDRERIRAVHSVKARRRLRKLGGLGGRRMP